MVIVEHAISVDIDDLIDLESSLFREDAGRHDPYSDTEWPRREGRADFERMIASDDALVLVARSGGETIGMLVGYAAQSSPTRQPVEYAILRGLYVAEVARRAGAATLMTEQFLAWARHRGCVEAHVDHYAQNRDAGRFYEQLGFAPRSVSRVLALGDAEHDRP